MITTPNALIGCNSFYFYIKPQPYLNGCLGQISCNSFYFYIKPQLRVVRNSLKVGCNSFYFYIKPQLKHITSMLVNAVIHSISTSNHNLRYKYTKSAQSL